MPDALLIATPAVDWDVFDAARAGGEGKAVTDPDLIRLTMQMAQKKNAECTRNVVPEPVPEAPAIAETPPSPPASPANPGLWHHDAVKEIKTADELAAMILGDGNPRSNYRLIPPS